MAFLARISGRCGLLAGRRTSRHFCFDNINFSRANIAFKIAMPNNRVVMQFNFQDESFQVDLDSSCSLNELRQALIEKGTCQTCDFITTDQVKMASGTDLSDLENHDFYALLDGKTLIRFNNKGVSNQKVTLYRQIGEKISMLGAPPYYYSSIIRGYLHRFETITSENCKIRMFDNVKDDKVEVDAELVIKNLLESLPDAKANQSLQTEIILAEYNLTKAKFNSMTKTRDFIMKKARIRSKLQMTLGLGALVGYFNFVAIGTYVRWSWDIVEPFAYFLNLAGIILLTSRYFKLKDDYENSTYQEYLANKNFKKIAVRFQFDEAEYNSLKKQLNDQKNKLKISLLIDL